MPTAKPPEGLSFDRLPTPIGEALLMWDAQGALRIFDWSDYEARVQRQLARLYGPVTPTPGRAPEAIVLALGAYFEGEVTRIDDIPCASAGTPFQRAVWAALRRIPAGTTQSYSGLAAQIGHPTAVRAVGLANGSNPIGLVVPCHRVIGADGSLTGYGGGLERKRWLLAHEGAAFKLAA
ncbi:MAG TPA: methylated-DNA--[protein]-cysteine S-methyltransferase [Caulobacteraceae bacterium]|nr:methylated-DNA--[protein]-cysteine S-methyltransferase [Caulobacteraceae bacterium]